MKGGAGDRRKKRHHKYNEIVMGEETAHLNTSWPYIWEEFPPVLINGVEKKNKRTKNKNKFKPVLRETLLRGSTHWSTTTPIFTCLYTLDLHTHWCVWHHLTVTHTHTLRSDDSLCCCFKNRQNVLQEVDYYPLPLSYTA